MEEEFQFEDTVYEENKSGTRIYNVVNYELYVNG